MSMHVESKLRDALRPVAPHDEFTRELINRMAAKHNTLPQRTRSGRRSPRYAWLGSLSLAASVLVAVGIQHHLQAERERALGMQARQQVIEALRVTSQKLDLAYQAVRTQSHSVADADPGV